MNAEMAWRLLGLFFLLFPLYFIVRPWMTRNWPTVKARVVEIEAKNPDGLFARWKRYNEGIDYGIEYTVDGFTYRKNPYIEMQTQVSGFAAKSIPLVPDEFDVRYHPDNPGRYSIIHALKTWAKLVLTVFCVIAGSIILTTDPW